MFHGLTSGAYMLRVRQSSSYDLKDAPFWGHTFPNSVAFRVPFQVVMLTGGCREIDQSDRAPYHMH